MKRHPKLSPSVKQKVTKITALICKHATEHVTAARNIDKNTPGRSALCEVAEEIALECYRSASNDDDRTEWLDAARAFRALRFPWSTKPGPGFSIK